MNFKLVEPTSNKPEIPDEQHENKINRSLFTNQSSKSIGLSIMEKMGFKVGDSLGVNNNNAIKEPILIQKRTHRIGLAVGQNKTEPMPTYSKEKVDDLKKRLVNHSKQQVEIKEVRKIMKLCLEMSGEYDKYLEDSDIDGVNELWRPYLIESESSRQRYKFTTVKEKTKQIPTTIVDLVEDLEQRSSRLLDYLRDTHSYCWYCGTKFNDQVDLVTNCPGRSRDVHLI
ncbi:uncharacterized protein SPAPADRAFT_49944 [Spathaspora passalidarum NRRL Y-27907]|uniref:G-patch domain-containing protein n=1 Tax=Spathaspora passalidarum (strain NRRL Y-27907 / 11-Y1) TaxID=619300 RepID=G3AKX6_SPAPN|nr:uncharacterized protein SPAPADRAFT_49944 [Spathaspora passalidarum NRRL Y-27907]EGW33019.1 hypothetical protein SPAPADRAFT_49944 [Spathaspora passalidarum NRRL Y-27907]